MKWFVIGLIIVVVLIIAVALFLSGGGPPDRPTGMSGGFRHKITREFF